MSDQKNAETPNEHSQPLLRSNILKDVSGGSVPALAVQLTMWSLVVGGLLCVGSVVTSAGKDSSVVFPCILSATVCFVAAAHYMILVDLRSSRLSKPMLIAVGKMTNLTTAQIVAAETAYLADLTENGASFATPERVIETEFHKQRSRNAIALARLDLYGKGRAALMEYLGDAIRFSDWLFTLPLLTLELHMIGDAYLVSGGRPLPGLNKWDAAAMSVGTVLAGALFRLALDDGKMSFLKMSDLNVSLFLYWLLLWGGAAVMFAVVCLVLVGGLAEQADGSAASHDVAAIMTFQLVQVGYPVVSVVDFLHRLCYRETGHDWRSSAKDALYGILDVASKSAFAVYVAFRINWHPAAAINNAPTG